MAAILAVVLGSSEVRTAPPRATVALQLGWLGDEQRLVGINIATGAPVTDEFLDLNGRLGGPLTAGGALFWYIDSPIGELVLTGTPEVVNAVNGGRFGFAGSTRGGVVRTWTLPPRGEGGQRIILVPTDGPNRGIAYGLRSPAHGVKELWAFDVRAGEPRLLTTAPHIAPIATTNDGRLIIAVGDEALPPLMLAGTDDYETALEEYLTATEEYLQRARHYIAAIDARDGAELARVELGGVIGQTVLTADRQALIVLGPENGVLQVIQLDSMQSERLQLSDTGPWPGAGSARPGIRASATLSADGTQLLIGAIDLEVCFTDPESCAPIARGVRVIDLASGDLRYEDPSVSTILASPDGRWLITTTTAFLGIPSSNGSGINVLDATTFEVVAHFDDGIEPAKLIFSPDSKYLLTLGHSPGLKTSLDLLNCEAQCATVTVIDLERLEVAARHSYDQPAFAMYTVP